VAHRLTTIEKHDRLIMIENVKIIKIGKTEEVILDFKNRE
jgi:ABC-type multidrug transport system fused ATPase/permease subunit